MTATTEPSFPRSSSSIGLSPEAVRGLTDAALLAGLRTLAQRSAEVTAGMLLHLAEMDARRLHIREGYPSLFAYCTTALGMSEGSAYKRISAARLVARLPGVLAAVASGRIHLSGLCVLGPHLRPDNVEALLARAAGKSKRDIECQVAARRAPEPIAPPARAKLSPGIAARGLFDAKDAELARSDVRAAPSGSPAPALSAEPAAAVPASRPSEPLASAVAPVGSGTLFQNTSGLAPGRVRLVLDVSPSLLGRLERAQALLGHAIPSGDRSAVLERALDLLIAAEEKRRFGVGTRPRAMAARPPVPAPAPALVPTPTAAPTAHGIDPHDASTSSGVPGAASSTPAAPASCRAGRPRPRSHVRAAVRRAVYLRDGGHCTFVGESGHRCEATHRLELDHYGTPDALGGEASIENLTLRCRTHNQHTAALVFGAAHVARRIRERRDRRGGRHDAPPPAAVS